MADSLGGAPVPTGLPAEPTTTEVKQEEKAHHWLVDVGIRLVKEKPLGTVGGAIVLLLFLTGIFADLSWIGLPDVGLAPYGYNEVDLKIRLAAPSLQHPLGGDNMGRDMLSRIIHGARVSMFIGVFGSGIAVAVSTTLGLMCGYFGGKFDLIVQRFVDAWISFPMLFIYLTVMAIIGGGMIQLVLVLGISSGIGGSRGPRALVFWIKENVYVEAARAVGAPTSRILLHHLLPNIIPVLILSLSIGMGGMIMAEAGLSFLGFGLPPPIPSWGGMISGAGRIYMIRAPWMLLWPGIALSLVIYGINMFGDALRDLLDPRLRGGLGRYGGISEKKLDAIRKKAEEKS